jgi:hypothetical protein
LDHGEERKKSDSFEDKPFSTHSNSSGKSSPEGGPDVNGIALANGKDINATNGIISAIDTLSNNSKKKAEVVHDQKSMMGLNGVLNDILTLSAKRASLGNGIRNPYKKRVDSSPHRFLEMRWNVFSGDGCETYIVKRH